MIYVAFQQMQRFRRITIETDIDKELSEFTVEEAFDKTRVFVFSQTLSSSNKFNAIAADMKMWYSMPSNVFKS
jgi:hypothetical protein